MWVRGPAWRYGSATMARRLAAIAVLLLLLAPGTVWTQDAATADRTVTPLKLNLPDIPAKPEPYKIPVVWDKKHGYLTYCPCRGGFGFQVWATKVESFLGDLALAKAVNRTLVIPPFIFNFTGFTALPFGDFFDLNALNEYQPVIPMAEFSDQLAPAHWKREKRVAHCVNLDPDHKCQHMYNPPGQELWYMHLIQFATTKAITVPTTVGKGEDKYVRLRWKQAAKPSVTPVIALEDSPGPVPALPHYRLLQVHLPLAPTALEEAKIYIRRALPRPYLAVHVPQRAEWLAHCANLADGTVLSGSEAGLAAYQCVPEGQLVPERLCEPNVVEMQQLIRRVINRYKVQAVYVATDVPLGQHTDALDLVITAAQEAMSALHGGSPEEAWVLRMGDLPEDPEVTSAVAIRRDIGVLAQADIAILNCVSTFSALVDRERAVRPHGPTLHWGQPLPPVGVATATASSADAMSRGEDRKDEL